MRKLGHLVIRHRRGVLITVSLLIPIAGIFGFNVEKHLSAGGFVTWSSPSARTIRVLEKQFHTGAPNILMIVTAKNGTVDESPIAKRGLEITRRLQKEPGVAEAMSYWSIPGATPLRGKGGSQALILIRASGQEDGITAVARALGPKYAMSDDLMSVRLGGPGEIFRALTDRAHKDLAKAEAISMPLTLLLLLLIFGSVVSASLPLGIGVMAIIFTFAVLRILALFTDVSVFSLNITTAMGLGLAIDYSLFVLSRYREELEKDGNSDAALLRTMHTAGRTVAFSAMSVMIAVATLLVFPLPFLKSFAYAGIAVVTVASLASIIVLPATIAVLGDNVNKWSIRRTRETPAHNFWYFQAKRVMRHPVIISVSIIVVLVLLGLPFLKINLGLSDDRALAPRDPVHLLHDEVRANFASQEAGAIPVVASTVADGPTRATKVDAFAKTLSRLHGVGRVDAFTGFYQHGLRVVPPTELSKRFSSPKGLWLSVVPTVEPLSTAGEDLVHLVRATPAPFPVIVGGFTAMLVDTKADIFAKLPLALILLNVATLILMFLMVGSVLVPLKSIVLNLFSLTATFGAIVWVFQEGHLARWLGFTPTGSVAVYLPIALFCIAFGLSQDYEVFLLSRVKEHYDLTRDNEEAVATGLQLSGRIISALAILLIVVFAAFATAEVSLVKTFGIGLALAIVVDAFIIRVTLAPALMRIAGHLNWWAPRRLRRLHLRYGIWEDDPLEVLEITDRVRAGKN